MDLPNSAQGLPSWLVILLAVAAVLTVLALVNHVVARLAERRHPPRGKFIEVDGARLHHSDRGTGPGFNWSSQHLSALIAAPHQELRRAFSNRASCAASR